MLLWLSGAIGLIASVITLIAFMETEMWRKWLLLALPGPKYNWASVPKHIAKAQRRVIVLQTWLPGLRLELPAWRTALAKDGVEFHVLLLDQKLVPYRLRCREPISSLLPQNVSDLTELSRAFRTGTGAPRLEVRFYASLPFGPVYIIDDDIYWGLYLADRDSMLGPVYHNRARSPLGRQILSSVEALWRTAAAKSGDLIVSPQIASPRSHSTEEAEIVRKIDAIVSRFRAIALDDIVRLESDAGCLCLLRHSDTDLNISEIVTGNLDVGINVHGREKARSVGKDIRRVRWDRIYSSPLRRCSETLQEALAGRIEGIELRDELRERSMGDIEGYSKSSYTESLPLYAGMNILSSFHTAPNSGEAYCDVFWRTLPLAEQIIASVQDGKNILVCAHEGPIRMLMLIFEKLTIADALSREVGNCNTFYYVREKTYLSLPKN